MELITIKHLFKVCSENKYIALRTKYNYKITINCEIINLYQNKDVDRNSLNKTHFISWRKCSFSEYISNKVPFLL